MTTNAPSLNMQFTYMQLLSLALQLAKEDRYRLCRDLTREERSQSLKALRDIFRTDELDEETIKAECEAVRQENRADWRLQDYDSSPIRSGME